MTKSILEKRGRAAAGRSALLNISSATSEGGKLKVFDDHIEFHLLWFSKKVNVSDIDFVETRGGHTLWFAHHGNTWRFLSFMPMPKDYDKIVSTLKELKITIKKTTGIKTSPY